MFTHVAPPIGLIIETGACLAQAAALSVTRDGRIVAGISTGDVLFFNLRGL